MNEKITDNKGDLASHMIKIQGINSTTSRINNDIEDIRYSIKKVKD